MTAHNLREPLVDRQPASSTISIAIEVRGPTPENEERAREVRARVWRYVFECHEKRTADQSERPRIERESKEAKG